MKNEVTELGLSDIVIVCVALIITLVLGSLFTPFLIPPKSIATQSAKNYINELAAQGDNVSLVNCLSADNDGDGTISCNVKNKESGAITALHCESTLYAKFFGGSCKLARPITINDSINQN